MSSLNKFYKEGRVATVTSKLGETINVVTRRPVELLRGERIGEIEGLSLGRMEMDEEGEGEIGGEVVAAEFSL